MVIINKLSINQSIYLDRRVTHFRVDQGHSKLERLSVFKYNRISSFCHQKVLFRIFLDADFQMLASQKVGRLSPPSVSGLSTCKQPKKYIWPGYYPSPVSCIEMNSIITTF